jgi:hypothetical protein
VQDQRQQLEQLLTEVAAVEPFTSWAPFDEDNGADTQEYCENRFWAAIAWAFSQFKTSISRRVWN